MKSKIYNIFSLIIIASFMILLVAPQEMHVSATGNLSEVTKTLTIKTEDSYTIKRLQKKLYYKGEVAAVIYYEYPQLKGSTKTIKSFNSKMKKKAKNYLASEAAKRLIEYKESGIEVDTQVDCVYYLKTTTRLTYQSGNVYSCRTEEKWWAGGVGNIARSGINFNKKTGKYLKITDVVAGDIKAKLIKKLKKNYPSLADKRSIDYIRNKKEFSFYIQNGKALVCFKPYVLGQGGAYLVLGLKLK